MTQAAQQFDDEQKPPYNIELTFYGQYNFDQDKNVDEVITYEDIIGYQVSSTVVAVMTKDGETLVYPLDRLAKIRHFPQAA
jgi:hypothetical protein